MGGDEGNGAVHVVGRNITKEKETNEYENKVNKHVAPSHIYLIDLKPKAFYVSMANFLGNNTRTTHLR